MSPNPGHRRDASGKSVDHSRAGLARWAKVDPVDRAAFMAELSKKAIAKKAEQRAALEALGLAGKRKRRTAIDDAAPDLEALDGPMRLIQARRKEQGLPALPWEALVRQAALELRQSVAESTYLAMRAEERDA
ncbi:MULTISPECIES: hypothetical protein [unclassified Agrococcus]|uniref:hypothetical protein n=1 Tax=unclassified Agrococcus TaxID=2615065 RepID=UPI003608759F